MNQLSDEAFIEKARSGDMEAFKALVIRHEGKVAGVVRSMLGEVEVESVGREVFMQFYESLDKFHSDLNVENFLVTIAMRLSQKILKKNQGIFSLFSAPRVDYDDVVTSERKDISQLLKFEFNRLDPKLRAVVTLCLVEGFNVEDTAEILDITQQTVLVRLYMAQEKLKLSLSKEFR